MLDEAYWTGNWDPYFEAGNQDKPIWVMIEIVRFFCQHPVFTVMGITGRGERYRKQSLLWLWRNGVVLEELLMRPDGDLTPTADMKVKLIKDAVPDLSKIAVVFEDRSDCTEAFKKIGLNVIQYHDARREHAIEKITR
jgi:hypothetical protein